MQLRQLWESPKVQNSKALSLWVLIGKFWPVGSLWLQKILYGAVDGSESIAIIYSHLKSLDLTGSQRGEARSGVTWRQFKDDLLWWVKRNFQWCRWEETVVQVSNKWIILLFSLSKVIPLCFWLAANGLLCEAQWWPPMLCAEFEFGSASGSHERRMWSDV